MIVLVLTAIGVASASFTGSRVRRLAQLPLQKLWLVWLAFLSQILLFGLLGYYIPTWATNALHLVTYALCFAFIYWNRGLPGGWIITVGAAANITAIVANQGTMPADADAWRHAGLPVATDFANSYAIDNPRLAFLGDIFYIPDRWPLANVFSIGDVLIVVGATYLAHRWCSGDHQLRARPTGSTAEPDRPAAATTLPSDELPFAGLADHRTS